MIYLAPTLTASHYLDRTEQWSRLPPETKDHAEDLIQKGSGFRDSRSQSEGGQEGRPGAEGGQERRLGAEGAGLEGVVLGVPPRHRQQERRSLGTFSFPGHMRIQQFRKKDGSFGAWLHRDSSTW